MYFVQGLKIAEFSRAKRVELPSGEGKESRGHLIFNLARVGGDFWGGRTVAERSAEVGGGGGGRQEAVSKNKTAERRKISLATTDFFSWKRAEYDCTIL